MTARYKSTEEVYTRLPFTVVLNETKEMIYASVVSCVRTMSKTVSNKAKRRFILRISKTLHHKNSNDK